MLRILSIFVALPLVMLAGRTAHNENSRTPLHPVCGRARSMRAVEGGGIYSPVMNEAHAGFWFDHLSSRPQ